MSPSSGLHQAGMRLKATQTSDKLGFNGLMAVLSVVVLLTACQGRTGTVRNMARESRHQTLTRLQADPNAYRVHKCPGAVIIEKVNSLTTMEVIGSGCRTMAIESEPGRVLYYDDGNLQEIVGPDNEVYGYVVRDPQRAQVGVRMPEGDIIRVYCTRKSVGR